MSELRTALIAGTFGVLASITTGWLDIFGQREDNNAEVGLATLKLESDLILKVRDYDDDGERLNYLCFVIKAGIVKQISTKFLSENGLKCEKDVTVPGPPTLPFGDAADPNFYLNSDPVSTKLVADAKALRPTLPVLTIEDGRLEGERVKLDPTFASDDGVSQLVFGIVFHVTCGYSLDSALNTMKAVGVSVHLLIDRDGSVYQLLNLNSRSKSVLRTLSNPMGNDGWVNVEIVSDSASACGNGRPEKAQLTANQIATSMQLARLITKAYNVTKITGHYDLDPGRRTDPGRLFPMQAIRDYANQPAE
jgi:N-acetylmuramoyl-L-alanine amidase